MKIPIALSLLILVLGWVLGWQEHQRHATARVSHDELAAQAAQAGIALDPALAVDGVRVTKRGRQHEDKEADAKNAAAEFIAYANEMEARQKKDAQPDETTGEQTIKFMDRMMALDPAQLKILIAEVRASHEIKEETRESFLNSTIMTLANDHPQVALALLTESPDSLKANGMGKQAMSTSLAKWAKDDPTAALQWVLSNGTKFPDLVDDQAKRGVICGTAKNNPRLAFKLITELGIKNGDDAIRNIADGAKTHEERTATLAALRAHLATLPEGEVRDKASATALQSLGKNAVKEGFEAGSKWLETAALTSEQLAKICDFSSSFKREESGKWVEWLGAKLPVEKSKDSIRNGVGIWTHIDYQAAGKWLVATPAGPTKNISVRSYAETVAQYEPETAAQWAMTLPPGEDRQETLKNIYQKWPENDEAAKQAFKKLHGIN
jgi:hypothetical protein